MNSRLLLFDSGPRTFAVEYHRIREVLHPSRELFPVPFSVPWLACSLSYKGSVVPVLDLSRYCGTLGGEVSGYLVLDTLSINLALRLEGPIRVVPRGEAESEPSEVDLAEMSLSLPECRAEFLSPDLLVEKLEESLRHGGRR